MPRKGGENRAPSAAVQRFLDSMALDLDRWREGDGYDLAALDGLSRAERTHVLQVLLEHLDGPAADWRDVDAVAALGTRAAKAALQRLADHPNGEVRLRAARRRDEMRGASRAEREVLRLLAHPDDDTSIDQLLSMAEEHPTPKVREALVACAMGDGPPELRVNAAALALYLAGVAAEPFDWEYRPLFLKFGEADRSVRQAALAELSGLMSRATPGPSNSKE